jgi:lipid A 3-O-deacylase
MRKFVVPLAMRLICLLALLGAPSASASGAESIRPDPRSNFRFGGQELGLALGYSWGFETSTSSPEMAEVEFLAVAPRWGIGVSNPLAPDRWYDVSFQIFLEASYLRELQPVDGNAGGLALIPRLNFLGLLESAPLVPYVDLGIGVMGLDFDLAGQDDGFSFSIQAGVGTRWLVTPRSALALEWRFHHISNANIRRPNLGINSSLLSVAYSYFF